MQRKLLHFLKTKTIIWFLVQVLSLYHTWLRSYTGLFRYIHHNSHICKCIGWSNCGCVGQ